VHPLLQSQEVFARQNIARWASIHVWRRFCPGWCSFVTNKKSKENSAQNNPRNAYVVFTRLAFRVGRFPKFPTHPHGLCL